MKGIQVCSNEGPRPFPRGDNYKIVEIYWQILKIFFSRTTWQIATKLGTKHPWVQGIKVCSSEGLSLFPREDNYKIAKKHWQILKIFFSKTTGLISTKLGTKHLWVKGIQVCSNEVPRPFPWGDNYEFAKIYWRIWKIIFSRTTGSISNKLSAMHPRVKGIQLYSNEGLLPFQRGDNYEIAKYIDEF